MYIFVLFDFFVTISENWKNNCLLLIPWLRCATQWKHRLFYMYAAQLFLSPFAAVYHVFRRFLMAHQKMLLFQNCQLAISNCRQGGQGLILIVTYLFAIKLVTIVLQAISFHFIWIDIYVPTNVHKVLFIEYYLEMGKLTIYYIHTVPLYENHFEISRSLLATTKVCTYFQCCSKPTITLAFNLQL